MLIPQTTPDEHPPTPPPCRWPALITVPALAEFQLVWRRPCDVVLFCSSCQFEHTLTAVCALPECQYLAETQCVFKHVVTHLNALCILDQTDLYRFEVRPELYGANARLVVSPPALSLSHPPTPLPSRWPALTTLPPLAKFHLVWRRLWEDVLSSALVGQKHPSLLSRLCLKCRRCKGLFATNMKIKSSIIFVETVDALTATFAV